MIARGWAVDGLLAAGDSDSLTRLGTLDDSDSATAVALCVRLDDAFTAADSFAAVSFFAASFVETVPTADADAVAELPRDV